MTDLQTGLRGSTETWRVGDHRRRRCLRRCCRRRAARRHRGCGPGGSVTCYVSGEQRSSSLTPASLTSDFPWPTGATSECLRLPPARQAALDDHRAAAVARAGCHGWPGRTTHSRSLVDAVSAGDTFTATLDGLALAVAGVVVMQAFLTFFALWTSVLFGQDLLSEAREYVVRTVLGLPLGRVESASTGDLVTRVTRDVGTMSMSVRFGLPESVIAGMTTLLTVVAMLLNSPLLTLPLLVTSPLLIIAARRYLKRAPKGYITEGGTYSQINSTFTETVEGARTVEALGLQPNRIERGDEDIAVSAQAERYTMTLRNLLFIVIGFAYDTPLPPGADPRRHRLCEWLGELGSGDSRDALHAGPGRATGSADPQRRPAAGWHRLDLPAAWHRRSPPGSRGGRRVARGNQLVGRNLRFAYRDDHDVLHGIDLALRPGERLAIVGPSGSGKSTLGRLLSGIHKPRTGSVTVGGVELTALPLPVLRTEVALVTQEHHVFVGTVRDNIILARESSPDDVVIEALRTVDAWDWVQRLPEQLGTVLGSGHQKLTPAQAQQVALARLVVADPHTLVLDEATSLIDPRTARHMEGSMAALLQDRTVVAIAHRLHTAHDADRIAVVIDGRIAELGSHQELVAAGGEYARLWRAWTS